MKVVAFDFSKLKYKKEEVKKKEKKKRKTREERLSVITQHELPANVSCFDFSTCRPTQNG